MQQQIPVDVEQLAQAVAHNCDIANANHAGDAALCIYLLRMREHYRWQHRLNFGAAIDRDALGRWLQAREAHWESLEGQPYAPLALGGRSLDPFDSAAINRILRPHDLVYSAGIGNRGAVHFFLARLQAVRRRGAACILIAGRELARDLTALPAMSQGSTVFVRREAIAGMLWEQAQESGWHSATSPMRRVLEAYGFDEDPQPALRRMVAAEMETFVQHELGELQAGELLGPAWQQRLSSAQGGVEELLLRALRDNLADALATLPYLLRDARPAALHLYFGLATPFRRSLQPSLWQAYRDWQTTGDLQPLRGLAQRGAGHWLAAARNLLSAEIRAPGDLDAARAGFSL